MGQATVSDLFYRAKMQDYLLNSNYVPDTVLSVFIYIIVLNPLSNLQQLLPVSYYSLENQMMEPLGGQTASK